MSPRVQTSPPTGRSAPNYRLRPAPRRPGPGGAAATRIRWDRLGRLLLIATFIVMIGAHAAPDAVRWFQARESSERQMQELRMLEKENRELKARSAQLKTPAAAEQQARERGMVSSGEISYVVAR
jgi:cell division protein FtsB